MWWVWVWVSSTVLSLLTVPYVYEACVECVLLLVLVQVAVFSS